MDSALTPTNVVLLLVAVLVAGIAIGWLFSKVRFGGSIRVSTTLPGASPRTGIRTRWVVEKRKQTSRTMELKCTCGSVWKFHDPAGPADAMATSEPGSLPFPIGDSFSCPNCGRAIDLRPIHNLENDALSQRRLGG